MLCGVAAALVGTKGKDAHSPRCISKNKNGQETRLSSPVGGEERVLLLNPLAEAWAKRIFFILGNETAQRKCTGVFAYIQRQILKFQTAKHFS